MQQEVRGWNGEVMSMKDILSHVGEGWHSIVDDLIKDLFALGWNGSLYQIKEKFGGLRFYIDKGNDEIFKRINLAELQSLKTCEDCGEEGTTGSWGGYWILTLCPLHGAKREKELEKEKESLSPKI